MRTLKEIGKNYTERLAKANQGIGMRISTGYSCLDRMTGGFLAGEFIVLGARPAMGKTAFAVSMALKLAKQQVPVLYWTNEMNDLNVFHRCMMQLSKNRIPSLQKLLSVEGEMEKLLKGSEVAMENIPLEIASEFTGDPALFEESLQEFVKKHDRIPLVIIDHVQNFGHSYDHRERELSSIIRRFARMGREQQVVTLCISQLSRAVETRGGDKRPQLSDLRESGALEQEADKVFFLHRPEYYGLTVDAEGNSTLGKAELIVALNRSGPLGSCDLRFDQTRTAFEEDTSLDDDAFRDTRNNEFNDPF